MLVRVLPCLGSDIFLYDVRALTSPDVGAVDSLARLQLRLLRAGLSLRLLHAPATLIELIDLMGLADVLRCADPLLLETKGQAEQGKESGGI
ncbi:MAG: hypothetical protein LC723_07045 [Actinobacteria bacterium]|nr:hypothetical protein [Actinomycetota bacterium]